MDTDYDWYRQSTLIEDSNLRPLKFYFLSTIVHVVLFSVAIIVGTLMPKPEIPPVIEITILDSSAPSVNLGSPSDLAPLPKAAPPAPAKVAESKPTKMDKDTVIVPSSKIAKAKMITKLQAKPVAVSRPKSQEMAPVRPAVVAKAHYQGPVVKESDTTAPILETEDFEKVLKADVKAPAKQLDEKDIADDLDKVDQEHSSKVAALKKSMDSETSGALAEQEDSLTALQTETKQQEEMMKKNAAAMKAEDQAKIANAAAMEKQAAAFEQAQARARAEQAAAAQAEAGRRAAEQAAAAKKYGQQMALGNALGVNAPVRDLSEIKQYPGNQKPSYEKEDRLAGRQGEVSFLAYVSNEGKITQFKLLKSTGHRSLDARTLSAIHSWKFYPGQEGWVEIPFRWDLKGGPQEMPATLRRSLSQK